MLYFFLQYKADLILFCALSLAALVLLDRRLKRTSARRVGVPVLSWLCLTAVLLLAAYLTETAQTREEDNFQKIMQGFAPTYAHEMEQMGHDKITENTPPDDPLYRKMVAAEISWLQLNPLVNDIYTFGKNARGDVLLLVDSETDYDKNGRFESEREQRTPIGELYPEASDNILAAFEGREAFDEVPMSDRWGIWISAYSPIRDAAGNVVAVLGVDYAAGDWVRSILLHRLGMLGFSGILIVVLLAASERFVQMRLYLEGQAASAAALRESERRFRTLSESAPIGIFRSDAAGRWTYANDYLRRLTGPSLAEGNTDWTETVHPADRSEVARKWKDFLRTKTTFHAEFRAMDASGDTHWLDCHSIHSEESGPGGGSIGTIEDTTQRRMLQSQLMQSQKMETVGTLAGGIAHDLNNQMTPLLGYVDFVLQDLGPRHARYAMLQDAKISGHRCVEIVRRLMNFAQPSDRTKVPVPTGAMLGELELFLTKFLPSTVSVRVERPDKLWPVVANETEIQTVFVNLAANARDAMAGGGSFSVRPRNVRYPGNEEMARAAGDYVAFEVRDTGSGIAPEILDKIFTPFFTTKPKERGTGLGLAMVFTILRDHKGWIEVTSQPGQGSCFTLYLPAKPDASVDPVAAEEVSAPPARGDETILIAEDEEALRNFAKILLEKTGYRVLTACDGVEALEIFRAQWRSIDAVVLDMTMPVLTGRQALRGLLQIQPEAKVVIVTGYTAEATPEELIREGAKEFLPKPYALGPLTACLRKVLDAR